MCSPTWCQSAGAELPDHGTTSQSVTVRSPSASGCTCVGAPTAAACPEGLGALTVLSHSVCRWAGGNCIQRYPGHPLLSL